MPASNNYIRCINDLQKLEKRGEEGGWRGAEFAFGT
jgi:hypothetical protein